MKAHLMYRDGDLDMQRDLLPGELDLIQDLELDVLLRAMAAGEDLLYDVGKVALLSGVDNDVPTILYRQAILRDCMAHPEVVQGMYDLASSTIAGERKILFGLFGRHPDTILYRSVELLQMFAGALRDLRRYADEHAAQFRSPGFQALFAMLQQELSDAYLAEINDHLKALRFSHGVLVSARLGEGNKGTDYVLRAQPDKTGWLERLLALRPAEHTITIADRDVNGAKALTDLREQGINLVANALAQSTDHVLSFFRMLQVELGFYLSCLNVQRRLSDLGQPLCFPEPAPPEARVQHFQDLYDASLALTMEDRVVGNNLSGDGRDMVVITGANQGGKSTFLRAVGLAQLMMQAGMMAPAEAFAASTFDRLFTHYRREEDATLTSGKFDEEMSRMSRIVDQMTAHPMILFNESFAATNDREGSEIARQIAGALIEREVRVFFVTHLYQFAHGFCQQNLDNVLFLRAERLDDGSRTFKVKEGAPLETSFGEDLYDQIFGVSEVPAPTAVA